jgi:hypothetical protein
MRHGPVGRRILVESQVGGNAIVMLSIRGQRAAQMCRVDDGQRIEALASPSRAVVLTYGLRQGHPVGCSA